MSNPRKQSDGGLMYPKRGAPPTLLPDGFRRDRTNPFHFIPVAPACTFRKEVEIEQGCCGKLIKLNCNVINKEVYVALCKECEGEEKWILDHWEKYGLREKVQALTLSTGEEQHPTASESMKQLLSSPDAEEPSQ